MLVAVGPIASARVWYATVMVRDSPGASVPRVHGTALHPLPDTTPCVSWPPGNAPSHTTPVAVLGPLLVTVTVYARPTGPSPATTVVTPSVTAMPTSESTVTGLLAVASLFASVVSGSAADTVAVVTAAAVAAVSAATTKSVTITTGAEPASRRPSWHVTCWPTTVHDDPASGTPPTVAVGVPCTTNPAGMSCTSSTLVASTPLTCSTVVVYWCTAASPAVSAPAGVTTTLVTAKSTVGVPAGSTVVSSVAALFSSVLSPDVVVTAAFVVNVPLAPGSTYYLPGPTFSTVTVNTTSPPASTGSYGPSVMLTATSACTTVVTSLSASLAPLLSGVTVLPTVAVLVCGPGVAPPLVVVVTVGLCANSTGHAWFTVTLLASDGPLLLTTIV